MAGNLYNILVHLSEDFRSQIFGLQNIVLTASGGQQVLLGNIAKVERASSSVHIDRKHQQRLLEVTANVSGRDLGSVARDITNRIQGITIPPGFEVKQTRNVEQQQKAFLDLLLAFGLAILLVYVVMASQCQSLLDPFIIMFTVPLGIIVSNGKSCPRQGFLFGGQASAIGRDESGGRPC